MDKDFPGKAKAVCIPENSIKEKQNIIHGELSKTLSTSITELQLQRFIPYVQMYEFEALLFSNPKHLAHEIGRDELETEFAKIKNQFETPEHINNSKTTAPSKRIISLYRGYEKVIHGSRVASSIGIENISSSCKLFANWVLQLKKLAKLE